MDRKMIGACLVVALLGVISISGCLDGKEPITDEPHEEPPEQKGTVSLDGWVDSPDPTSLEDVQVSERIDVLLPHDKITSVTLNIEIRDGDEGHDIENTNTQPDQVTGEKVVAGDNKSAQINGGSSPFSQSVTFKADAEAGEYLGASFQVTLAVLCRPSEDQWPGPLIWSGYYDEGFYYAITGEYTYLGEPAAEG